MVRGAFRSGSKRVVNYRTPSGSRKRYEAKKVSKQTSPTGKQLPGTASGSKTELAGVPKTRKRPNRPYGGVLSSPEMRAVLREQARLSLE